MFIVPVEKRSRTKNVDSAKPKAEFHARPLNANDIQKMSSDELHWHSINNAEALDAALKTEAARSPQQREDTRVTGLTNSASKEAGERRGWDATKVLTYADIQKMTADESLWHSRFNRSWRAAFDEEDRRRQSKTHVATTRTKLQWQGHATDEEIKKTYETGAEFSARFPQFLETSANMYAMLHWMKDNDLPATELSSYISAYRALSQDGRLEMRKVETAEEFLKSHPELCGDLNGKPVTPPLIKAREAKVQATADFAAKTQAASAKAGSTTVIDYEDAQTGYPQAPSKCSFRRLLDSLSAEDYQKRLNEDAAFRAAVDKLEK